MSMISLVVYVGAVGYLICYGLLSLKFFQTGNGFLRWFLFWFFVCSIPVPLGVLMNQIAVVDVSTKQRSFYALTFWLPQCVALAILTGFIIYYFQLRAKPELYNTDIDSIEDVLNLVLRGLEADRVQAWIYHSPYKEGIDKIPFRLATCRFEVVRKGIEPQRKYLQNYPVAGLYVVNECVTGEEALIIKEIEELRGLSMSAYHLFSSQQVKGVIVQGLYTSKTPLGFLLIQRLKKFEEEADIDLTLLLKTAKNVTLTIQRESLLL